MYKFAVTLVLCCTTGHAQYAPAELFYQQNVQRATVGTIHQYVPGSSHNFRSPTGTTVQDRFPLTQPVLRSPTIQQSKAPQKATEEIKARYQRELEVTLKHTRALKQRRATTITVPKKISISNRFGWRSTSPIPGLRLGPTGAPTGIPTLLSTPPSTVTTPSTAGGGTERVPVPISASTGRATLSCRRRARRWEIIC